MGHVAGVEKKQNLNRFSDEKPEGNTPLW